jgi:SAM-dependent methyltransferase
MSTLTTQYNTIGAKYNDIKILPATLPERPSLLKALGDVSGNRCLDLATGTGLTASLLSSLSASSILAYDISPAMIASCLPIPNVTFAVRDCSVPAQMAHDERFDVVTATWFLNYAGTQRELIDMFSAIEMNLKKGGRFVGLTTNAHDAKVAEPKRGFYGLDVEVLDPAYADPETQEVLGIKARVRVGGQEGFAFDVFQFGVDVYERCAKVAGMRIRWGELVTPTEQGEAYWAAFRERPTFEVVVGWRVGDQVEA